MPETTLLHPAPQLDDPPLSPRDRRLAGAGVRIPRADAPRPVRFAGRRRPRWLAALIRIFT
jgi:hypothetical protein